MMSEGKKDETPSIGQLCKNFTREIESLGETLPLIAGVLYKVDTDSDKVLDAFIEAHASEIEKTETGIRYALKLEDKREHDKLQYRRDIFRSALAVTPKSFFVSLISTYDAFLGQLLKGLFCLRPQLLSTSDRTLTLAQLLELESVEAAREHLLEKEIESVLRKSHAEQFTWMEGTFAVTLRKGLECWTRFIEMTERRNLFVHTDGIVSSQYLKACKSHGVELPDDIIVGKRLHVESSYFTLSSRCLHEIGIKLAHVLWRKLAPEQREAADTNLIELTFDQLVKKNYRLAKDLLDFAVVTLKQFASDETRRILTVNRAIAYKFSGEQDKAIEMLKQDDWSSCSDVFQLAVHVLCDRFDAACAIMKCMGTNNRKVGKYEYREWPLFKEFRKSELFKNAYREVFKEEFVLEEQEPKVKPDEPGNPVAAPALKDSKADDQDDGQSAPQSELKDEEPQ